MDGSARKEQIAFVPFQGRENLTQNLLKANELTPQKHLLKKKSALTRGKESSASPPPKSINYQAYSFEILISALPKILVLLIVLNCFIPFYLILVLKL